MPATIASSLASARMLRVFAFAGLLSLASCARQLTSLQVISDTSSKLDYFMFVRQWPGTLCSKQSCPLFPDRGYNFTVHGLWPSYDDGSWPQFCDADYKFDERKLKDLMDELEAEWPSVYDMDDNFWGDELEAEWPSTMESNEDFWQFEWLKHGTCSRGVFPTEQSYFSNALKLHRRYDLGAALRKADIVPDKHKVYRAKDLADAVHDMYGIRPVVRCENSELSEMWLCFDKELRPFNCDEAAEHVGDSCEELTIPPLQEAQEAAEDEEEVQDGNATQKQQLRQAAKSVAAEGSVGGGGAFGASGSAAAAAGDADDVTQSSQIIPDDSIYWLLDPNSAAARAERIAQKGAAATGAGAMSSLAALAERTISELERRLTVAGGHGGDLVNDNPFGIDGVVGEALPLPNGGASAAASSGVQDFVWTSKLRNGADELAFSADEAEERASLVNGGAAAAVGDGASAAAALSAVTQDGEAVPATLWMVRGVLVLPSGGAVVDVGQAAPPTWVVVLLAVQLICVVVIALSLVVLTGMAMGARWGPSDLARVGQQRRREYDTEASDAEEGGWQQQQQPATPSGQQQQQCWAAAASLLCGAKVQGEGELVAPLLLSYDEDEFDDEADDGAAAAAPPKIYSANRDQSVAAVQEQDRQQQQQQQGWHVNPLRGERSGSMRGLPTAAAAAALLSPMAQPPYAPLQ